MPVLRCAALALDQLRAIAYDPTWNPAADERLFGELSVAIAAMPREVLSVDIGFAQDGMLAYWQTAHDLHLWRLDLKASLDRIEAQMLERGEGEQDPLWWLLEIPLSILVEPLDWLFTVRDVLQGDMLALVGLLPFVPSQLSDALRSISDAGRFATSALNANLRQILSKLDDQLTTWGDWYSRHFDLNAVTMGGLPIPKYSKGPPVPWQWESSPNLNNRLHPLYTNLVTLADGRRVVATARGTAAQNAGYAGLNMPFPERYQQSLRNLYGDTYDFSRGLDFTSYGTPIFDEYAVRADNGNPIIVAIENMRGNVTTDFEEANRVAREMGLRLGDLDEINGSDLGIWHHVEDGHTMVYVLKLIHVANGHFGGQAVVRFIQNR